MPVRILIGENEDLKELAEEHPKEAAVIKEMLEEAESDTEAEREQEQEEESADA